MNTFKQLNTQKTNTISFQVFDYEGRSVAVLSNHKYGASNQSNPQRWTLYRMKDHAVLSDSPELMTIDQALKFFESFDIKMPLTTYRIVAKTAYGFTLYQGRISRSFQGHEIDAVQPMRFNEASRKLEELADNRPMTTLPGDWVEELHLVNTETGEVARILKPLQTKPTLYL